MKKFKNMNLKYIFILGITKLISFNSHSFILGLLSKKRVLKHLIVNKRFFQYYFFVIFFFIKKNLMICFFVFKSLKLKKMNILFNILYCYKFLKKFSFYFFKSLNFFYCLIKELYGKIKMIFFSIRLSALFSKFRTWLYEDVYIILKRYLFIFIFNKYKQSVQKKPKKMSILYFYWLEYNMLVYVGVLVFLFYIIYIFQFEIIFYYFPDVFILRLNDLMNEPQLGFLGTNSFFSDTYINPQFEKRQLNISSLVGGSSYLFFKYRRFVRGIQYMQSHETVAPFWSEYPYSERYWDPKRHRMPGDKTQTYKAVLKDEKLEHHGLPFAAIWHRVYVECMLDLHIRCFNSFKGPIHLRAITPIPIDWKYVRGKYKEKTKTVPFMLASVPLLKIKSTPFFYLHVYNLTEQKKYKQKLLYKKFMSKLSSSDIISKLPYNIDGQNLIRLVAHHQQLVTKNEKHSVDNSFFHQTIITDEDSQNLMNEDGKHSTWKNLSLTEDNHLLFELIIPAIRSYYEHFYGIYGLIDKMISKVNIYERPTGSLQQLHLNNLMYTQLEKYMYSYISHYSYSKWNRVDDLMKKRIGSYYRPDQKYIAQPAEVIRDSLYLPYLRENPSSSDDFFTNSEDLELRYSRHLTGWFRRYANRLYEAHYKHRVSPYRFVTRLDLVKKGVFFPENKKYKMFFNYNLHYEPNGIRTNKKYFNNRQFPKEGIMKSGIHRVSGYEKRKRFRDAFFMDDEFLIINALRPPRSYKIKRYHYDWYHGFVNYVMTSKYAVDSPSRESFWKRFFSRYNYKKKDYYLYYGKRVYDFDKYKVDFSRRYDDIVFLLPERLFSFISAIIYRIKRREGFFLAKPYGKKKKSEQVDVHDYIVSNSKTIIVDILRKIYGVFSLFFIKIFLFGYNLFVILVRSLYHFIYSFFHISFLLTKIFDFVKKGLYFLLEKINKLSFVKSLGINEFFSRVNIGFNKNVENSGLFKLDYIYFFFEKSIFYRVYLKSWMYFTNMLNFYYSNLVGFFNNNIYIMSTLVQMQNLKKILLSKLEKDLFCKLKEITLTLEFSLKFSFSLLYKVIKLVFKLVSPIVKGILVFFIEYVTNIISKILYLIPGISKRRGLQLKYHVRTILKGDFEQVLYQVKTFLLGFFPLKLQHFRARLRVYLEEKNLKRFRYKTLMLNNTKNSYIWVPKRRILTSQFVFWIFVYVFFYLWICHLKLRLFLEEIQNVETVLFCVTPLLLAILCYLFSVVPGPVLDILVTHSFNELYGLVSYLFDPTTGEINVD